MAETRTSEFEHNNPKKSTKSTEDGFSGLPSSEDEDGLSSLSCYGAENDKGGVLEDGFSGLCSSGDGLCGEKDAKGGILEEEDGLPSYVDEDVEGGILEEEDGLASYVDEDVKGGMLKDGLPGLCCHGEKDVKGGTLEDGFSGLPASVKEDGLSGLSCYGEKNDKVGILEDGFSGLCSSGDGLCCYGEKDVKGGILQDGFAEKVKKERRMCELRDPLAVLGSDIMLLILSCLDARSVALCLIVSSVWRAVASSDKIWSLKCEELWQGKTHLPRIAEVNKLSKLAVYSLSAMDGKRKRIRREDLCDHGWEFHFTEAAPEYWRMLDPFWNGTGLLMRRYFLPDGSHTADPDDKIWGGHECCYTVVTGLLADGKIREHYVRINRSPPMYVTKKEDWSWELSNYLCTYRSLPDADKEDGTGPLLVLH